MTEGPMNTRWRLVPVEATEEMQHDAWRAINTTYGQVADRTHINLAWDKMLAAAPSPADAEIDELCRMMWPHAAWWKPEYDGPTSNPGTALARGLKVSRDGDRRMIRAFLEKLNGK